MKFTIFLLMFLSLSLTNGWAADEMDNMETASAQRMEMMVADSEATYKDIKNTLGLVPSFLKAYPEEAINGAWMDMKGIQLNPSSAIPGKYKELIGVAVAAQIPCRYCIYFHTKAAKVNKAGERELNEAIALAAETRKWGAYLSGTQVDVGMFRSEVDKMLRFANRQQNLQAMEAKPSMVETSINTPEDVYKDMKKYFGFVPTFVQNYPKSGLVGLWRDWKGLEMNPDSAIPGIYKDLIGLAVAAQANCQYCTYFHTKSALMQGATKDEINEAVAMSGIIRQWSTVLNGKYTNEETFIEETDKIMKFVEKNMNKEVGLRK